MRAIAYSVTGGADVLRLVDRPVPDVGDNEVRVRIIASGVNPTDWKARTGVTPGEVLDAPRVPNQDGAGVIDAVGPGVTGLEVGDRVWVWDAAWQRTEGTAQELVTLPARQVVPLPPSASFDTGASLGIPALTAHLALTSHEATPMQLAKGSLAGRTVLVAGGAGAVGHAAIQLAVWAGASVVATVSSPEKAEYASRAGAHQVVNYRTHHVASELRAYAPEGVDIIVEVNPSANLATDLEVVATNGSIAIFASTTFGAEDPEILNVPVRVGMSKNMRLQFILTYMATPDRKDAAVRGVSAALADGALPVGSEHGLPLHRFPLEEMAAAHRASEKGVVGKVLVDVATPEQ
jgi:NADPH2:quinone reductase